MRALLVDAGVPAVVSAELADMLEAALEAELDEHLAVEATAAGEGGEPMPNQRNGRRSKKVMTEVGQVEVAVPRDRAGTFAPAVIAKAKRRTTGIAEMVASLTARGMTTGDIVAHLKDVFDIDTTKDTVSTITDRVLDRRDL